MNGIDLPSITAALTDAHLSIWREAQQDMARRIARALQPLTNPNHSEAERFEALSKIISICKQAIL